MAALQTILVPFDGSPPSLAALEHALALAEDGDARIDVLTVDAPEEFEVGSQAPLSRDAREEIDRDLEAAVERARAQIGSRVSRRTTSGDPLRKIIETASEGRYDLIVMGTHGRTGRLHSILGSVAEGVIRNSPCPVLVVRELGGGYQSFAERRHRRPTLAEQWPSHKPT